MKTPTLIVHNGKSKMYAGLPDGFYDGDWQRREFPDAKSIWDVQSYRPEGVTLFNGEPGLWYTSELAGAAGASFTLFKEPDHTAEDVRKAKGFIRRSRDVVGPIKVVSI